MSVAEEEDPSGSWRMEDEEDIEEEEEVDDDVEVDEDLISRWPFRF